MAATVATAEEAAAVAAAAAEEEGAPAVPQGWRAVAAEPGAAAGGWWFEHEATGCVIAEHPEGKTWKGWVVLEDPASRAPFYFCEETGESTWDAPEGFRLPVTQEVQAEGEQVDGSGPRGAGEKDHEEDDEEGEIGDLEEYEAVMSRSNQLLQASERLLDGAADDDADGKDTSNEETIASSILSSARGARADENEEQLQAVEVSTSEPSRSLRDEAEALGEQYLEEIRSIQVIEDKRSIFQQRGDQESLQALQRMETQLNDRIQQSREEAHRKLQQFEEQKRMEKEREERRRRKLQEVTERDVRRWKKIYEEDKVAQKKEASDRARSERQHYLTNFWTLPVSDDPLDFDWSAQQRNRPPKTTRLAAFRATTGRRLPPTKGVQSRSNSSSKIERSTRIGLGKRTIGRYDVQIVHRAALQTGAFSSTTDERKESALLGVGEAKSQRKTNMFRPRTSPSTRNLQKSSGAASSPFTRAQSSHGSSRPLLAKDIVADLREQANADLALIGDKSVEQLQYRTLHRLCNDKDRISKSGKPRFSIKKNQEPQRQESRPSNASARPRKTRKSRKSRRNRTLINSLRVPAKFLAEEDDEGEQALRATGNLLTPVVESSRLSLETDSVGTASDDASDAEVNAQRVSNEELTTLFGLMDSSGDGFVDLKEMKKAIQEKGIVRELMANAPNLKPLLNDEVRDIVFQSIDVDASGDVSLEEFLRVFGQTLNETPQQRQRRREFRRLFDAMDRNGDGSVDMHELRSALRHDVQVMDMLKQSETLRPLLRASAYHRVSAVYLQFDSDNSGTLEWPEFLQVCELTLASHPL